MNRNASIELTRVIGCLMVIMLHIRLNSFKGDNIVLSNFGINCITRDGVTLFWIIQGFFLSNKTEYICVLRRTLLKIVVPALMIMLFCSIFAKILVGGGTWDEVDSLYLKSSLVNVLVAVTNWNASLIPCCSHLWYIFAYIQVVLWYPLLNIGKEARRWVMGIMLLSVIVNDIQQLYMLPIGKIITYSVIGESVFFVLLGREISEYFSAVQINPKKIKHIGIMAFLVGNAMKGLLSILLYAKLGDYTSEYYLRTGTFFAIISATGLFLFINSYTCGNKIDKLSVFLGKHTYFIYLLHWLIKDILTENGVDRWFKDRLSGEWVGNIMYHIIYTALVFLICLIITILVKQVLFYIKHSFYKIKIKGSGC